MSICCTARIRIRLRGWRSYCRKTRGSCCRPQCEGRRVIGITECDGIFWLIDPAGRRLLSKGVNTVRFDQERIQGSDRIPYAGSLHAQIRWPGCMAGRRGLPARALGFQYARLLVRRDGRKCWAVAACCRAYLDLGMSFAWRENERSTVGYQQEFPDVFDQNFDRHIQRRAEELCGPRRDEQQVLGWFVDNELRWCPDWRGAEELLGLFLGLPPAMGRKAALDWLKERHHDFTIFNASWQTPACSWDGLAALAHIDAPYRRDPPYQRRAADEEAANRADPGAPGSPAIATASPRTSRSVISR